MMVSENSVKCALLGLVLLVCGAGEVAASSARAAHRMEQMSLVAPFNTHDATGSKVVPFWDKAGDTFVKQSFLRVVPDSKQSRGAAWTRFTLGKDQFSLMTKFRLSGRSEKDMGESLGFFVATQQPAKRLSGSSTSYYGFGKEFVGVGVIVDTNRKSNSSGQERHRDITIIVNDGTRTEEEVMANLVGCNANVRFYEGRDDFNVLKSSRIRFRYQNNELAVEIDSRNIGRWRRCAAIPDLNMPEDWLPSSTISVVAVNGESGSSNADVLELRTFEDADDAWDVEKYDTDEEEDDYDLLVHHMEHEMFSVEQNLRATLAMLEEAELAAQERIKELETRLSAGVTDALSERLEKVEVQVRRRITATLNNRINSAERGISSKLESTIGDAVRISSSSWQTPFFLLIGIMGAMGLVTTMKYRDLKKQHIL